MLGAVRRSSRRLHADGGGQPAAQPAQHAQRTQRTQRAQRTPDQQVDFQHEVVALDGCHLSAPLEHKDALGRLLRRVAPLSGECSPVAPQHLQHIVLGGRGWRRGVPRGSAALEQQQQGGAVRSQIRPAQRMRGGQRQRRAEGSACAASPALHCTALHCTALPRWRPHLRVYRRPLNVAGQRELRQLSRVTGGGRKGDGVQRPQRHTGGWQEAGTLCGLAAAQGSLLPTTTPTAPPPPLHRTPTTPHQEILGHRRVPLRLVQHAVLAGLHQLQQQKGGVGRREERHRQPLFSMRYWLASISCAPRAGRSSGAGGGHGSIRQQWAGERGRPRGGAGQGGAGAMTVPPHRPPPPHTAPHTHPHPQPPHLHKVREEAQLLAVQLACRLCSTRRQVVSCRVGAGRGSRVCVRGRRVPVRRSLSMHPLAPSVTVPPRIPTPPPSHSAARRPAPAPRPQSSGSRPAGGAAAR